MKIVDLDFEKIYMDYKKRYFKEVRPIYPWYIHTLYILAVVGAVVLWFCYAKLTLVWEIIACIADSILFSLFVFFALRHIKKQRESRAKKEIQNLYWKCLFLKGYLYKIDLLKAPYINYLESLCNKEMQKQSLVDHLATFVTVVGPLGSILYNFFITNTEDTKLKLNFTIASIVFLFLCIIITPFIQAISEELLKGRRKVCADLNKTLVVLEANM